MPHNDPSQERKVPQKNDLAIELLGTSFSITAEEDSAYLENILTKYRQSLRSIQDSTGLRDPLKLAILTGFLLCDQIQRIYLREAPEAEPQGRGAEEPETAQEKEREAERITLDLIARIDAILEAERGAV
jgi:cell division protein ZapA (FtsZ GTPase activity inhibitor)